MGTALVAGRKRVPMPATGKNGFADGFYGCHELFRDAFQKGLFHDMPALLKSSFSGTWPRWAVPATRRWTMGKWGRACALTLAVTAFAPHAFGAPLAQAEIAAALGAGNGRQAEQLADAALANAGLAPGDRSLLLADRGTAREAQGRHDDALVDLTQAIDMHALSAGGQAHALFIRGTILDSLGRPNDAIGDYSAALTLQPRYAPALNNRANAYRLQNRLAEAKRDYLASLAAGNLQPEYSFYGLGEIAEAAGNRDGARGFYSQAVAANPNYGLAAERLAALGGGPDEAANAGVIHLRPPKGVRTADAGAPVVLQPPGAAVHLHSPRVLPASYAANRTEPGLRPALDAATRGAQAGGQGGGQVQLGAWRTEDEAGQGWNRAQRLSGGLLAGLSPHIVAADLPGRGRYYRLRVGPAAQGPARLCAALTAQGVDCIPARD